MGALCAWLGDIHAYKAPVFVGFGLCKRLERLEEALA
jgi:hypothetical protein